MSERRDLLAICHALGIVEPQRAGAPVAGADQTDIELLKFILTALDVVPNTTGGREQYQSSGKSLEDSKLKQEILADSLAFPEESRRQHDLSQATESWSELKRFNDLLRLDYTCRRQMLLNRLDCTVESFKWKASDSACQSGQSLNDLIHERYDRARAGLREEPRVSISHLLAARQSDSSGILNSIVSSKSVDCQVAYKQQNRAQQQAGDLVNLKQIIIPDVPDRGGRPGEIRPPQRETFSQQRRARGGRGSRR